jgi:hypothetical protein
VVRAYHESQNKTHTNPTIGELRSALRLIVPKNQVPDDRVIRDILKRLELPIAKAQLGRPKKKSRQ